MPQTYVRGCLPGPLANPPNLPSVPLRIAMSEHRVRAVWRGPERRNVPAREALLRRIRAEYGETGGMRLTGAQARRLFGMREDVCARVLNTLVGGGFLRRTPEGFTNAGTSVPESPSLQCSSEDLSSIGFTSMSCAGVGDGHGQGGGDTAHTTLRDNTAGTGVSKATVVGALIGLSISVVSAIVLVVQIVSWLSSWAMVLRRLLGYP